jgi:hypothetical protein
VELAAGAFAGGCAGAFMPSPLVELGCVDPDPDFCWLSAPLDWVDADGCVLPEADPVAGCGCAETVGE